MTKDVNWEKVELDYRAGIKTLREIGDENNISHTAITKRAKRDGWVRDLTAKIQAKAADLVSKSLVSKEVTKEQRISEQEIINANAVNNSIVELREREDIRFGRGVVSTLMQELKAQIDNRPILEEIGEIMRNPDKNGNDKINDIYMKTISFSGNVDNVKKLAESDRILIDLERRVYKLDTDTSSGNVEDFLRRFRNV